MTRFLEFHDLIPVTPKNPRSGEGGMVLLKDGRLFFAYSSYLGNANDWAPARIICRYSRDVGRTWTEPQTFVTDEARKNVTTVSLLRLHSGGILFFYVRRDSQSQSAEWLRRSDDETRTWSEPICCTPAPLYQFAVNDSAVQLASGRVILPYSACDEYGGGAPGQYVAATAYSDDDGTTWKQSNSVYSPKRGAMEPRVVQLGDGRLCMLIRTDRGVIDKAYSDDDGITWSSPVSSGIESPQSPFVFKRIPSTGDLLLIRNPIANLELGHQGYRTPLRSAISKDEGKTWVNERNLEVDQTRAYSYPSATFVEDMAVLSYYVGWLDKPGLSLRIARVPITWFYE